MINLRETVERELKLSGGSDFSLAQALEGEPLESRLFVSTSTTPPITGSPRAASRCGTVSRTARVCGS